MGRRSDRRRQAASCPQLDLRLNLSPTPPGNHYNSGDHDDDDDQVAAESSSPVRSTCSSSCDQNSSTEEVTTTTTPPAMVVVGCPRCLMYVMLSEVDPKCPKCKSSVLLHDFINPDQRQPSSSSSSTIFPN